MGNDFSIGQQNNLFTDIFMISIEGLDILYHLIIEQMFKAFYHHSGPK